MSAKNGSIKLVAGNSNPALAAAIADWLHLPLAKASVRRFADKEIFVEMPGERPRLGRRSSSSRPRFRPTTI